MTQQNGNDVEMLDISPDEPVSTAEMIEMAEMIMEQHARGRLDGSSAERQPQPRPDRWWDKAARAALPFSFLGERNREILSQQQAGRRARGRHITYRGNMPGNSLAFAKKFGAMQRNDNLDWATLNIMRRNPMIKLGLTMRAAPVFSALREARAECPNPDIAAFVEQIFIEPWLTRMADSAIIPSYIYGSAPHEKSWENRRITVTRVDANTNESVTAFDGNALVYKNIDFVMPETLESYNLSRDRRFDGFTQKKASGDAQSRTVPAWKAFVFSNRFLYGLFWGESEVEDIYPSWYYASYFRALMSDYMRLRAIPPVIATAPAGSRQGPDGEEVDNLQYVAEAIFQAFVSQVVALPWESDPISGVNRWDYKEMVLGNRVEDIFTRAIEELEVNILRGLLVPERTVMQNVAAVGSYNQAEIHQERMLDAAKREVDAFLESVNRYLVPQLVEDNFGGDAPVCRVVTPNIPERIRGKLHNVLITLLQNDTADGRINRSIKIQELLKFLDIPYTVENEGNIPVIDEVDEDEE
jgi:hypothetical protein